MLEKTPYNKSLIAYFFCCVFLFSAVLITHRWDCRKWAPTTLSWDVAGYYFYLPTIFYDDLAKPHNIDYIKQTYDPMYGSFYGAFPAPNGNYVMKYPCGQSIMYLPGFVVAHFWAKWGGYPVDGFSWPYQYCIAIWSVIVSCIGLWFMRRILLQYFSDAVVAISLLTLVLATNYLLYASISGAFTHSYLFTVYALIIYTTDKWYKRPTYIGSIIIGLLCGLAALTRPTEIITVLIPLLWKVGSIDDLKNRINLWMAEYPKVLVYILCVILMGSIQLIYWRVYSGHFLYWSYSPEETFSFGHPHIINGLMSYKKGWFTYTPVMIFSIIGFIPLYRYKRDVFWATIIFMSLYIYITFSWDEWWYGGSFSQRAMIQSYALLLFPLSALFNVTINRFKFLIPIIVFVVLCIWLNVLMIWQATESSIMESDNMTCAYYWRIFGRTSVPVTEKKLLDDDEVIPQRIEQSLTTIYTNDFESDSDAVTDKAHSGKKAWVLNKEKQWSPAVLIDMKGRKQGWIRAYAYVYFPDKEWNVWQQTLFTINVYSGNISIKDRSIRIQRILNSGLWSEIWFDIKLPSDKNIDKLKVCFWNDESDKTIYIDDLHVAYTAQN